MNKKKKTARKRKPGAQPNNKNALRHGFYSKAFTADENSRLDNTEELSVVSEIKLLRVCIDRLQRELDFEPIMHADDKGNENRDDHYLKALNTLGIMTNSLSTLTRTHYLTKGRAGDVADTIQRALEELRLEMGL